MATPLWVTLGMFAFNSFVSLHSHHQAQPATHQVASDSVERVMPPRETAARQAGKLK
jgi:hypothetical protein